MGAESDLPPVTGAGRPGSPMAVLPRPRSHPLAYGARCGSTAPLGAGGFFVVYGFAVLAVGLRPVPRRGAAATVITAHTLLFLYLAIEPATGGLSPTPLGTVLLTVLVALMAAVQGYAPSRSPERQPVSS